MSDRPVKECRCPRAKHQHGTRAAYTTCGCRCLACRLAEHHAKTTRHYSNPAMWAPRNGTILRLQALACVGWSDVQIAALIGRTNSAISLIRKHPSELILRSTAERITEAYDQLWDRKPPETNRGERVAVARARARARRNNWLPPMALDDDHLDDPDYTPTRVYHRGGWDHKPCGTEAAAKRHRRRGEPLDQACLNAERRGRDLRRRGTAA